MRKIIFLSSLFLAIISAGCNQQDETKTTNETKTVEEVIKSQPPSTAALLTDFTTFPPEIEGCLCWYGKDSTAFGEKKYSFATTPSHAYLIIDGKPALMKVTDHRKVAEGSEAFSFENEAYSFYLLTVAGGRTADEVWQSRAKLTVVKKADKSTVVIPLSGECGC